jgi:hypothetical protein
MQDHFLYVFNMAAHGRPCTFGVMPLDGGENPPVAGQ